MKKCKYCGKDIYQERDLDGTYNEGYCDKLHRKYHEKELIKEGKIEPIEATRFSILKDTNYRDANGELVWFPKDDSPYFDRALQRTFHSRAEKVGYMKEKGLVMDGSSDKRNRNSVPEAGDTRWNKVR